jgi:tetratricopeptide (TPR) repeat protein/tRNA A-37 threonylcarbamoyl transferase component Bud32
MTPERYREVKEHFHALSDLEPGEKREYLDAIADRGLRADVEDLLRNTDPDFLESPLVGVIEPQRVGPYVIEREIGRGGMGVVYLASRNDEHFRQRVAIKIVKRGFDTDAILERFRRERQIVANLDHPNIARLLDGGTTSDGRPFFVMEYVEGERIDAHCASQRLSVEAILRLFRQVCAAVQFAHQNLVVHRDLKPANIMVTADGIPKLLDFGIAKLLREDGTEATTRLTTTEGRLLTPAYASPEQLAGTRITTASDVYSLGVILWELLTGRVPSARPAKPGINGDIDNILLMALRHEPERRYASVGSLSEDLRRHLGGLPVSARGDTFRYRASKFVWRNPWGVASATAVVLALIGGIAATTYEAQRAREAQARAERRSDDVRRLASSLMFDVHDAIAHLEGATAARGMIVRSAIRYLDDLAKESGGDPKLSRDLALAYVRVGNALGQGSVSSLGDQAGAERYYRKAIAIQTALLESSPGNLDLQNELATTYERLMELGSAPQLHLEMALNDVAVRERIVALRPHDLRMRRGLALAYERASDFLGNPYWGSVDLPSRAIPYAEKGLALRLSILAEAPNDSVSYLDVQDSETEFAAVLWESGRHAEALAHDQAALAYIHDAMRRFPEDGEVRRNLYTLQTRICRHLQNLGRFDEALTSASASVAGFDALLQTDPKNAMVPGQRVNAMLAELRSLRGLHRHNEAAALGARVLEIIHSTDVMHNKLGREAIAEFEFAQTLALTGDRDAAIMHCRVAIGKLALKNDSLVGEAYILLGDLLHSSTEYQNAIDYLTPIAAKDPTDDLVNRPLQEARRKVRS